MRDVHRQDLLVAGQHAEVGHRPVQAVQLHQVLDKSGCLLKRDAEQDLN